MAERNAIVTGGGGSIGGVAARELAARGIRGWWCDVAEELAAATVSDIKAAGGTAIAHAANVADEAAVKGYVDACVEQLRTPSIFFNNAAREGAIAVNSYPVDEFDKTIAVNLRGVFLGLTYVIPAMRKAGGG